MAAFKKNLVSLELANSFVMITLFSLLFFSQTELAELEIKHAKVLLGLEQ